MGQKHNSGTKNIVDEITFNKNTAREIKLTFGQCSICNRKKPMIVSDNTILVENLGDFLWNLGQKWLNVSKNMAKNILRNPGRALEIGANVDTAFFSKPYIGFVIFTWSDQLLSYRKRVIPRQICMNYAI